MLTKMQCLEVENKVLRESIGHIKDALERLDGVPSGREYDQIAIPRFLGHVEAAVHYEHALVYRLKQAEQLEKKNPGSRHKPGKIEKK